MLLIINTDKAEYRPAVVCVVQNEQGYEHQQSSHTGIQTLKRRPKPGETPELAGFEPATCEIHCK